jgi:sugar lactone lactonase YvrE
VAALGRSAGKPKPETGCRPDRILLLVDGLGTVNGLGFSPDGRTLCHSDSQAAVRRVWASPYDPATGVMGASRPFIDVALLPGKPDGAAVDRQGGIGRRRWHRPGGTVSRPKAGWT